MQAHCEVRHKLVLDRRRRYLTSLLVKRKHHGEPIPQGEVIPGDVKPLAALIGPSHADARPDFLPLLIFTRASAVVAYIRWCVRHGNVVSDTAFSVGNWQRVSTRGAERLTG